MSHSIDTIKSQLGKPYELLEFLLHTLSEVLVENNENELVSKIPWLNDNCREFGEGNHKKVLKLYSISFQLLNLAEVNGAVQNRRKQEEEQGAENVNGLWSSVLFDLKEKGIAQEDIIDALKQIHVEPVLTAHPTEAKRPVVLGLYRELYLLIVKLENSMYNSYDREEIRLEIKQLIHKLWHIDEIFIKKPEVESELENVLHYFRNVFPEVLPLIDTRLKQSWIRAGFDKKSIDNFDHLPHISFGNWVAGDRDGHPFVTADVTEKAMRIFRNNAIQLLDEKLALLANRLSLYLRSEDLPISFLSRMSQLKSALQTEYALLENEPLKQYVELLRLKLPFEERTNYQHLYHASPELVDDLILLTDCLSHIGADALANNDVQQVIRHLKVFGFHLAHFDIRQNSKFYENALMYLLEVSGNEHFKQINDHRKLYNEFIVKELDSNRPFVHRREAITQSETKEVLNTFWGIEKFIRRFGQRPLGSLIVSMTRNVYDLFTVYLFMRETGLTRHTKKGLSCMLPVVPLFETIEDLKQSHLILDQFLSHQVTRNSLDHLKTLNGWSKPVQDVMIGYSDSNKDGGIIASIWYLHYAQKKMAEVGRKHGVNIRFFHGKGGTISRGAGPTHWFLKALPKGSLEGQIRVTEQGETVERKYANKRNAAYNLELLLAGTAHHAALYGINQEQDEKTLHQLFTFLADESQKEFKKLTNHRYFIRFYEQATPIDVLENSKIGSRPARRTGKRTLADLRAIPWVFSWTQSRMQISSWYGVGTTLNKLSERHPDLYEALKGMVKHDPFVRYVLTNIDTSLAATDEEMIKMYSNLVEEKKVRSTIRKMLLDELALTRANMHNLLQRPMEERRRNHYYSTQFRALALKPLHQEQVRLLANWRKALANHEMSKAASLFRDLLASINAIANAMGSTG